MIKENKMYYSSKPGLIAALALGNFSSPSRIIFCNNANRVMISDSFSGNLSINFRQAIIDRSAPINATLAEPSLSFINGLPSSSKSSSSKSYQFRKVPDTARINFTCI